MILAATRVRRFCVAVGTPQPECASGPRVGSARRRDMRTPSSRRVGDSGETMAPGASTPQTVDSTKRVLAFQSARPPNRGLGVADADFDSIAIADKRSPGLGTKTKSVTPNTTRPPVSGKTQNLPGTSPLPGRARDLQRKDALGESSSENCNADESASNRFGADLRDRGATDAVAHLRQGTERWFVTAQDSSKEVAWWQLTATKEKRRADAAQNETGKLADALRVSQNAFIVERETVFRFEAILKGVFDDPIVRDALRAFPENAPHSRTEDDSGVLAARVFRALETRIVTDGAEIAAAHEREVYLANTLRESERQKFGAFAAAHKAREELKAHVKRLRVDNEIRKETRTRLEANEDDARELPIVKAQLVDARLELVSLTENETRRVEIQKKAVHDAVESALKTKHDDTMAENTRLIDALRDAREKLCEQGWEQKRAVESSELERAAAMAGVAKNANELREKLRLQCLETRHADAERTRVAQAAGQAVERAISQREWALEVLDREVEVQESFSKKLAHEFYKARLCAKPETFASEDDDAKNGIVGLARSISLEFHVAKSDIRNIMTKLHGEVAAMTHAREAARVTGLAAGWSAALRVAERATTTAGPVDWPATNRVREKIAKGRYDARVYASRGPARRAVLKALGRDLPVLDEQAGVIEIERLMMPTERRAKKQKEKEALFFTPAKKNANESAGDGDFYDAETPTTAAARASDYLYDSEMEHTPHAASVTPKSSSRKNAATPYRTPGVAGEEYRGKESESPKSEDDDSGWIDVAREQAVASLLRRGGRKETQSLWGTRASPENSPRTPKSASKRLAFATPPETRTKSEFRATPPKSSERKYAPSRAARLEIEKLAESLQL